MSRIAANPIPYWARNGRVDKSRAVFEEAFADFAAIGFTAVKADVPDDMAAVEYAAWIGGYGLEPSLSLFNSPFDETMDIIEEMERAKRFAATQVALGIDRTMVSSMSIPERMERPAVGADFDPDRLALAIENCGIVCEVLRAEGLRPLHHPHVGGVFETEYEITRLLDELGPGVIGFGPDTGHLRWAGIDPAAMIKRYADRVGGIHIKDIFGDHLDVADPAGSYPNSWRRKRLWAEPGLGVIDFDAVLAAIPDDYDGDFMIEIDHPSVASRYESHRISFEWAQDRARLTLASSALGSLRACVERRRRPVRRRCRARNADSRGPSERRLRGPRRRRRPCAASALTSLTGAPAPRRWSTQAATVVAAPTGTRPAARSATMVGTVRTTSLAEPSAAIRLSTSRIRGLENRSSSARPVVGQFVVGQGQVPAGLVPEGLDPTPAVGVGDGGVDGLVAADAAGVGEHRVGAVEQPEFALLVRGRRRRRCGRRRPPRPAGRPGTGRR